MRPEHSSMTRRFGAASQAGIEARTTAGAVRRTCQTFDCCNKGQRIEWHLKFHNCFPGLAAPFPRFPPPHCQRLRIFFLMPGRRAGQRYWVLPKVLKRTIWLLMGALKSLTDSGALRPAALGYVTPAAYEQQHLQSGNQHAA